MRRMQAVPSLPEAALLYRAEAMDALGELLDLLVNGCGVPGADAAEAFVASGMAAEFERRNPAFLGGRSAVELAEWLATWLELDARAVPAAEVFDRSADWWLGEALAFFQVQTGRSYAAVFERVGYEELVGMYHPLHEAPFEKFAEVLLARLAEPEPTRLAQLRTQLGYSQAQLAARSGVGLQSIQFYEQRRKDINKAQANHLLALAQALGCSMEALLER